MTDDRALDEELDWLAADYAIGLSDAAERVRAEALIGSNPAFRAAVMRWSARLAPLLDEVDEVEPPPDLWATIAAGLGKLPGTHGNVVSLTRRLRLWRGIAAGSSALAASLALFVAISPRTIAPPVASHIGAAPLVATIGDKQTNLVASWDPNGRQLILVVAAAMPADPRHSHELWVIPSGGKPHSLGTMSPGPRTRMNIQQSLATLMRDGATIAVSVERPGGSPTGVPTGPVVASGVLQSA